MGDGRGGGGVRDRATRGGEEHTQRFDAPTARGSSRTSTSTPNQPAVATTRQETTSHADTTDNIVEVPAYGLARLGTV